MIETIQIIPESTTKYNSQAYDFFYVLDFEATCWESRDRNRRPPEIIEFSVVLYDVKKKIIIDEFQKYVMPTEVSQLSEFCKQFTGIKTNLNCNFPHNYKLISGITQQQLDNEFPLGTILMLFMNWIKQHIEKFNFLLSVGSSCVPNKKLCAFVTWTDWDLGTCLPNECKRKNITKPSVFNEWIDLKALYIVNCAKCFTTCAMLVF